jgi:SAM-dependent methyltransferase
MQNFISRDSTHPDFWNERFEQQFTPWDQGGVQQDLRDFVASSDRALRTLIPGCGNGYEVVLLAQAGWDVTAIDFSPAAVASAKATIGAWGQYVVQADFFEYMPDAPLDLIYERAFFCALPPNLRQQVVVRWADLLKSGALLAGYFFFDDSPDAGKKGPPFSIPKQAFFSLMEEHFSLLAENEVSDSLAIFQGKERWLIWQKK